MPSLTAATDAVATPFVSVVTDAARLQVLAPFARNSNTTDVLAGGRQTSSVAPTVWTVPTTLSLPSLPGDTGFLACGDPKTTLAYQVRLTQVITSADVRLPYGPVGRHIRAGG